MNQSCKPANIYYNSYRQTPNHKSLNSNNSDMASNKIKKSDNSKQSTSKNYNEIDNNKINGNRTEFALVSSLDRKYVETKRPNHFPIGINSWVCNDPYFNFRKYQVRLQASSDIYLDCPIWRRPLSDENQNNFYDYVNGTNQYWDDIVAMVLDDEKLLVRYDKTDLNNNTKFFE
jgi:hypothetical protein